MSAQTPMSPDAKLTIEDYEVLEDEEVLTVVQVLYFTDPPVQPIIVAVRAADQPPGTFQWVAGGLATFHGIPLENNSAENPDP